MALQTRTTLLESDNNRFLILVVQAYVMCLFILPKESFESDRWCWINWSIYLSEHGLGSAYSGPTNYPPIMQYVLWLYAKIQVNTDNLVSNIYILKAFSLVFDFLGAWMVVKLVNREKKKIFYFFLLVLNPIFVYNTLMWGQVDAVHAFFLLMCCIAAVNGKILPSGIWFFLAVNFKLQSIVYFPVIGLLLLPVIVKKENIKAVIGTVLLLVSLQLLIILPFILNGELSKFLQVVIGSVDYYPVVSANAYNIWYWIVGREAYAINDVIPIAGLSAKIWGLILFCISSFALLFPLLYIILSHWMKGTSLPNKEKYLDITLISGALVTMNLFFFATQMHERYSHIAMIFTCAYTLRNGKWLIFCLYFLAYFLNLEAVCQFLDWENYHTLIFYPGLVAAIFFIFMLLMYKDLFKIYITR